MDLLGRIGLDRSQKALLARIALASVGTCVAVVLGAWAIRGLGSGTSPAQAMHSVQGSVQEALGGGERPALLPIDIDAHEWAADYYLKIDQPQRAIDHLARVRPMRVNDRLFQLRLATAYMQALRYSDAFAILSRLSSPGITDSLSDSVEARLGLILFYLGRTEESRSRLEAALKEHPGSREAACYLGQVKASVNATSAEAEHYFRLAIAADKNYAEAWYQLARLYMAGGKYEKARTALQQVLQLEPLHIRAHSRLGMVYYYLDMPDQAMRSYETALALNPDDYNTHYNLGELYYAAGNSTQALSEFRKALTGNPEHAEANFKVGLICLTNNMLKEAVQYFEKARSADPRNTRVLLQLGVAYEKLEMREEALSVYQSIIAFDALNPVALQKIRLLSQG